MLLTPLECVCIGMMILLGLMLAAWIIDWVFVFRVWPEGIATLEGILDQELARTYDIECWCGELPRLAVGIANFLYDAIFRVSGIHDMGVRFAEGAALSIPDTMLRNAYLANYEVLQVAMVGTQLLAVRVATLSVGLPLFVLLYAVAVADGIVQRAIRRAGGGRESASLYHRAKHGQIVILVATAAVCLLMPSPINMRILWGLGLVTAAALARMQWSYYKKHL